MQQRLIRRTGHTSLITWLVIVVALSITIAVGVFLFRGLPASLVPVSAAPTAAADAFSPVGAGTHARIVAGDVRIERRLPATSFALRPGQVLDPRLPAGPFTAGDGGAGPVMMDEPVFLPDREVTFTYRVRCEGDGPVRFQAMWRPEDASADLHGQTRGGRARTAFVRPAEFIGWHG